jgi:hypothetical protein
VLLPLEPSASPLVFLLVLRMEPRASTLDKCFVPELHLQPQKVLSEWPHYFTWDQPWKKVPLGLAIGTLVLTASDTC